MNSKRKLPAFIRCNITGLIILFLSLNMGANAQSNIGGIINTVSSRIDAVYGYNTDPGNVDSVHVSSVTGFNVGDTVLIHMTVGASFYTTTSGLEGYYRFVSNTGKYAIFIVKDIDVPAKIIVLNSTLPGFLLPLANGEYGQIVKIPTYKRAAITSTLTCNPYDPVTGTGGILVMLVNEGLEFKADINVDGKGFPGAKPDTNPYPGTCSTSDPAGYSKLFYPTTATNFAALKGYGVAITSNDTASRGRGKILNGGGGGNGKYSGGGGGGNGGAGGKGGYESAACGSADLGGLGGFSTAAYFYQADNRISLGGGGGTSTQSLPTRVATAGGDGGGIVIILCDTLKGNKNISAKGNSVSTSSTAGAGGGGAGGTIILHVNHYVNPPAVIVNGGDGGNVSLSAPEACGPGGGGGSGVIWFNGLSMGSAPSFSTGKNGTYNGVGNGALGGTAKPPVNNMNIPIRGFILNYIPDPDTICMFDAPLTINAAKAIGGTGVYSYKWQKSSNNSVWLDADSVNTQQTYKPLSATTTSTYYRRIINDGFLLDTSNVVRMIVLPILTNNNIKPDTTVCANLDANALYSNLLMAGGSGKYRYKWEKSSDAGFTTPDSVGKTVSYPTPALTNTSWYRRVVTSGPYKTQCISTSNNIKITVLPVITNNILSSNQEICTTKIPDILTGNPPGGGAGAGSYTYKWQRNIAGTWSDTATTANFQPPSLTASREYRRIVISGLNQTCQDTTPPLLITVMPSISSNSVNAITQNILCSGLNGETLTATSPGGGNGTFSYYWQNNTVNAPGGNLMTGFNPGVLTGNSAFRRIITSGTHPDSTKRCINISNTRTINILEKISNNTVSIPQSIWCQGKTPADITGTTPLNGDGSFAFVWQGKLAAGNWADGAQISKDLNTPEISSSVDYRRVVKSGLNETCKDTSNIISLIMQDSILNNKINDNTTVFVCYGEDSLIQASLKGILTGGDETTYSYEWTESPDFAGTYTTAAGSATGSLYQAEGIKSIRYYKRRVNSGDCENTSMAVKVDPLALPELTSFSVNLPEICYNKLDSMISVELKSGNGPSYYVSFSDGQGLTDSRTLSTLSGRIKPQIDNPDLDPGSINYSFKVESILDSRSCYSNLDSLYAIPGNTALFTAGLTVFTTPMPTRISDVLEKYCGPTLGISVNPSIGISKWVMSNNVGIDTVSNNAVINLTANYSSNDSASVSLAYVENIANCPSDTIYVDAILYHEPDPITSIFKVAENGDSAMVGDPVIIFISDNQKFRAKDIIYGEPGWNISSGAGELSETSLLTTSISGLVKDDPTVLEYSISNGVCEINKLPLTIIRKELEIYDGFSPNGDSKNPFLYAKGLADEEVDFKFQIFSSSGHFVREISRKDILEVDMVSNEAAIWDGTTKLGGAGNIVPEGTYYYVLVVTYKKEDFSKRGYVIVKR